MFQPHLKRSLMTIGILGVFGFAASAQAATHFVDVRNFEFDPPDVVVAPGDTVQWDWTDAGHSVTSGSPSCTPDGRFDSGVVGAGSTFSFVVPVDESEGVIPYYCIPHCLIPMEATITVVGLGPPVPTTSQWGVVVMALLLLAAGTIAFAWKRKTAQIA